MIPFPSNRRKISPASSSTRVKSASVGSPLWNPSLNSWGRSVRFCRRFPSSMSSASCLPRAATSSTITCKRVISSGVSATPASSTPFRNVAPASFASLSVASAISQAVRAVSSNLVVASAAFATRSPRTACEILSNSLFHRRNPALLTNFSGFAINRPLRACFTPAHAGVPTW